MRDVALKARNIAANSRPDYERQLEGELAQMRTSELWRTGVQVRTLRP